MTVPRCIAPALPRAPASIRSLTLLADARLPAAKDGPRFGGISGMDFNPTDGTWRLLSDDPGAHGPPRWYRAWIEFDAGGVRQAQVGASQALPLAPHQRVDPEALRRHPCAPLWAWASEGDRAAGHAPSLHLIADDGGAVASLELPARLRDLSRPDRGPVHNRSIEGLAFTPDGQALWVAMEAPLLEDAALPDTSRGAPVRFTRLPLNGRGEAQQFVYRVDAVPQAATGGQRRADNGVAEILALDADRLLVIERSGREVEPDRFTFHVRLYEATRADATDVQSWDSLRNRDAVPMRKRLLLDLTSLGLPHVDNIEAAAWGPPLADGRATLVLAADDNFSPHQATQLLVLAIDAGTPAVRGPR